MDLFVFVTAIIVSIDAMAAGFALAMRGSLTPKNILVIGGITLMLCLPAALCGEYLEDVLGENVNVIGGAILILVGARNLSHACFPQPQKMLLDETKPFDAIAVGIAVGLDAAVANLSISLMGNHSMLVPLLFAAMHIIAVSIGYICLSFFKHSKVLDVVSALLLVAIGIYKIIGSV